MTDKKMWDYTAKLLQESLEVTVSISDDMESFSRNYAESCLLPLLPSLDPSNVLRYFMKNAKTGDIMIAVSPFETFYVSVFMDEEKKNLFIVGPFVEYAVTDEFIYKIMENLGLKEKNYIDMKEYYQRLPVLDRTKIEMIIRGIINELVSPELDGKTVFYDSTETEAGVYQPGGDEDIRARMLEERYAIENHFLEAVSEGNLTKAYEYEHQLGKFTSSIKRTRDSIRNRKNMLVIMNTLLRKSAEKGGVHPIYLDKVSNKWAIQIEGETSFRKLEKMHEEMVRSYCILVKNYSLDEFSPLVRRTINYISINLSGELTVQSLGGELGVTPDYLSRIFKKETGTTIIDYINRRRIDASLKLLNATDLQIQDIASYVGIGEVSYFGRLFKRYIGMSPGSYRRLL